MEASQQILIRHCMRRMEILRLQTLIISARVDNYTQKQKTAATQGALVRENERIPFVRKMSAAKWEQ